MDAPDDGSLVREVRHGDDDDPPPGGFEILAPGDVPLALPGVAFVVPAVVLDQHHVVDVDEVAARQESPCRVDDDEVATGLGKPGEHHHQPDESLHRRLDPGANVPDDAAKPTHSVEVRRNGVGGEPLGRRVPVMDHPVAGLDQLNQADLGGDVDERALRARRRDAVDDCAIHPVLALMHADALLPGVREGSRRDVQGPGITELQTVETQRRVVTHHRIRR
jgi:hypothetical protein